MPLKKKTQAVVFDWDNTLVDSWPILVQSMNATLAYMGHPPWTPQDVRNRTTRSMKDYFPELFGERWEEAGRFFHEYFLKHHLQLLTPLPGAADMLRTLKDNDIYLAVVSNKIPKILRIEAEALGWMDYFGVLVGSGSAARDKPAPDPLYAALEGSGIESGPSVWFVGDTTVDIECGKAAGCPTALVGVDGVQEAALALNPDFCFYNYKELILHLL